MNNFDFVSSATLRSNINQTYELILELVFITESEDYLDRKSLVSSLRKTAVIHTASVIEALLLWKFKKTYRAETTTIEEEWIYKDIHTIHKLNDSDEELIWCKRKNIEKKVERLDFLHLIRLCEKHAILENKQLIKNINKVREMRNKLHIGNLLEIDNKYEPADLEFCFSVLEKVRKLAKMPSRMNLPTSND